MDILEVTCWLPEGRLGGGGAVVCLENARALRRLGHDVRIFAGDHSQARTRLSMWDDDRDEVPVTRLALEHRDLAALWRKRNPEAAARFGQYLDRDTPDIVHFHSLQGLGHHCLDEALRRSIPAAVTLHDHSWITMLHFMTGRTGHLAHGPGLFEAIRMRLRRRPVPELALDLELAPSSLFDGGLQIGSPLAALREALHVRFGLRRLLARADLLIAPSEFVRAMYQRAGLRRLVLVRNGAPAASGRLMGKRTFGRPLRFGVVSGLQPEKGLYRAIRAIRRFSPEAAQLWIYGADEPTGSTALTGPEIHWVGRLPVAARLEAYDGMDVLLALSVTNENCPLTVLEAQAAGVPIIASDIAAHRELIRDGEDGLLVALQDFEALVHAMRTLVEDRRLLHELCSKAPVRPDATDVARELERLFSEVLESVETRRAAASRG